MPVEHYDLDYLNSLQLNEKAVKEFDSVDGNSIESAMVYIDQHIETLRHDNGRKIRSERRHGMSQVLFILYGYMYYGFNGECSPSMRSIAHSMYPELEAIEPTDSPATMQRKEKAMAPALMFVQRTIKMLEKYGLIRIHHYRADSNQESIKNPNFFYEIIPVSTICAGFAALISSAVKAVAKIGKLFASIKESVLGTEKVFSKLNNLKPSTWAFPEPPIERQLRLMGVLSTGIIP